MADINTSITTLANNIQTLRDSRSALAIDRSGELIRLNFKGKIGRALVDSGIGREGKWGHRVVVYLIGKDKYDLFCEPFAKRFKESIGNVSAITKRLETQGLDSDLSKLVKMKINEEISAAKASLTKDSFIAIHERIRKTVPQRLMYRASLADKMKFSEATPMMKEATYRGVAIAVAALEKNMEQGIKTDELLDELPMTPLNTNFAEEVCGLAHDHHKLKRDVWDANRILRELKSAELDVREEEQSALEELKELRVKLQNRIADTGSTVHPKQVADWELELHTLQSQIKDKEQHFEDNVKAKVAALKQNLLISLKNSFSEKREADTLTATEAAAAPKPKTALKSAMKKTKTKPKVKFGGLRVEEAKVSYLSTNLTIDDTNRDAWRQDISATLDNDKDPQVPYAIAHALAKRGEKCQDDGKTAEAISLLRTHPAYLQEGNFEALMLNIDAATEEEKKFPDNFPDEVKQNYRKNAETFKKLAQQRLDATNDLITHLEAHQAGMKKLDSDPDKRAVQLQELEQQLDKYKTQIKLHKDVFEDADKTLTVTYGLGGRAVKALPEMLREANNLRHEIERMLRQLEKSPIFENHRLLQ